MTRAFASGRFFTGAVVAIGLLAGSSTAFAAPPPRVMIDLGHGEAAWSNPYDYESEHGWGPATDILVDEGFTWSVNEEVITPAVLACRDLVIVSEPASDFAPAEIDALRTYVAGGGGLMLLTDWGEAVMNPLSETFGVTFPGVAGDIGWIKVLELAPTHPVTAGVSAIYWPLGTSLVVTNPGVESLAFYRGEPVLAALTHESGRVLFGGDNEIFARFGLYGLWDFWPELARDNDVLLRNSVKWLAGVPDSDCDGVRDDQDACPGTTAGAAVGPDGCSVEQECTDGCDSCGGDCCYETCTGTCSPVCPSGCECHFTGGSGGNLFPTCQKDSTCHVTTAGSTNVETACDGATCATSCEGGGSCGYGTCGHGADCSATCSGATECAIDSCKQGSRCSLSCEDTRRCEIPTCNHSECTVECGANVDTCKLDCSGGPPGTLCRMACDPEETNCELKCPAKQKVLSCGQGVLACSGTGCP